jgi:hypothetical protein
VLAELTFKGFLFRGGHGRMVSTRAVTISQSWLVGVLPVSSEAHIIARRVCDGTFIPGITYA